MITDLDKLAYKIYKATILEGYDYTTIKDFIVYKFHYIKYYKIANKHLRKIKLQKLYD